MDIVGYNKSNPTRSGEVLADRVGYRKSNPTRWGDFLVVKVGFGKLMVRYHVLTIPHPHHEKIS